MGHQILLRLCRGVLHWVAHHCLDDVAEDLLRETSLEVDAEDAARYVPVPRQ